MAISLVLTNRQVAITSLIANLLNSLREKLKLREHRLVCVVIKRLSVVESPHQATSPAGRRTAGADLGFFVSSMT